MPGRSWRAGQPGGDGKPVGPDRPLEKGVGGIEIGKSSRGQPCCQLQWLRLSTFSAVGRLTEFLREPRHPQMPGRSWRAGQPGGDGKPAGPDRPLEKGDGGIEIGKSSQGQPCCQPHVAQPTNS